jgi:hypothetical protein
MSLRLPVTCLLVLFLHAQARADNYNVTNTNDNGPGSLRQAILDANSHPNIDSSTPDTIGFAISGGGLKTITPLTELPVISDPIVIDGYTQPGASANTLSIGDDAIIAIELNGNGAPFNGITISAGHSTARGLVIDGFSGNGAGRGIWLNTNGSNRIEGCFISTNPTGTAMSKNQTGIWIDSPNNVIGGAIPAARNLISQGVVIGSPANSTTIQGNYLGVTADGTTSLGIGTGGISLSSNNNLIGGGTAASRNIIASGVSVFGDTAAGPGENNTIQGNYIGTNATGSDMVPAGGTAGTGITLFSANFNLILGNVIAGFGNTPGSFGSGISISSGSVVSGSSNTIQGNFIGTNANGTASLPNGTGIRISSGSRPNDPVTSSNVIGGTTSGTGNVISGNDGWGISISGGRGTSIQGNFIGVGGDGHNPLPNGQGGIQNAFAFLPGRGNGNVIGGTTPGAGNVIAFNGVANVSQANGIKIESGTGNAILGNSIFGNYGLGIDLGSQYGPTPNDLGDSDSGANLLQNFPIITSVSNSGGSTSIAGTLNSVAATTYRVEFFANEDRGQRYLGSSDVTTDANGNASFNFIVAQLSASQRVSATATDPNGNTSEFSPVIGQLLNISSRLKVGTDDNVLIGGFIINGTEPKKVIIRGIGPSLGNVGIQGYLADPILDLYQGNTLVASNDNWKFRSDGSSQQSEVEATTIAPTDDLESAIVATLQANVNYTAVVRGNDKNGGIGVVEAYDLDQLANSKFANISTRGFIDTGNNVLIGGFITGNGVTKVLVRAIGPTLTNMGVTNPLQDPTLELKDGNGVTIRSNDDWKVREDGSTQQGEIEATSIPPTDDRESALVQTIPPGNYTAVVRGKNNTSGTAVVEVYNIQ